MKYKPSFNEKLCGEYLPFIIMGLGVTAVKWMVFGDAVKAMI